jgi:hypothetical protein
MRFLAFPAHIPHAKKTFWISTNDSFHFSAQKIKDEKKEHLTYFGLFSFVLALKKDYNKE